MNESKLFFEGSSGCIFKPNIPCEGSKKRSNKRVSKLILRKNKEYKIGLLVKKIPKFKEWTILWENLCLSPEYEKLLKNTEIKKCLYSLNVNSESIPLNHKFTLYQGFYGGLTLRNYIKKTIKREHFNSENKFIKIFKKIFKLMYNVFYGLKELNKYNICHHDININNILINKNKAYIIDYDISLEMKNLKSNEFLINRMKEEFNNYRIYETYPYEYIYYPLNEKEILINEQNNIALYQNRLNYYEIYEPIHHKLFNIDTDNLRFEYLEDKLHNEDNIDITKLINKLDVYSLGMTILIIFISICEDYDIKIEELLKLFKLKELKFHMDLIRDMTEFCYKDRISIEEAYERYKNLI